MQLWHSFGIGFIKINTMFQIIIDPDFIDDPKLNEQKAKLEPHFKDWPCTPGREGYIYLSNDTAKKKFMDCRASPYVSSIEIAEIMQKILYPHLDFPPRQL
jgi:hypothetical protein